MNKRGRPPKDNVIYYRRVTKEEKEKLDKYLKELRSVEEMKQC